MVLGACIMCSRWKIHTSSGPVLSLHTDEFCVRPVLETITSRQCDLSA
jgi:hypothetical protein